jgi:glutaredoxin
MKKIFILSAIILMSGLILTTACSKDEDTNENKEPDSWEVIVYGIPDCGLCSSFKDELDKENIPYTFYDINTNNEKRAEMMEKLTDAGYTSDDIAWPIVDVIVDGVTHIMIQPDIDKDIKPLIGR